MCVCRCMVDAVHDRDDSAGDAHPHHVHRRRRHARTAPPRRAPTPRRHRAPDPRRPVPELQRQPSLLRRRRIGGRRQRVRTPPRPPSSSSEIGGRQGIARPRLSAPPRVTCPPSRLVASPQPFRAFETKLNKLTRLERACDSLSSSNQIYLLKTHDI